MAEEEPKEEYLNPVVEIPVKPLNLGHKFYKHQEQIEIDQVLTEFKLLAVFFGASWCNITKLFLKPLIDFYEQVNLESKEMEIIYAGFEKSQEEMKNFTKTMPWLYIPFSDPRVQDLKQFYKIRTIPQIVSTKQLKKVLKSNGTALQIDARQEIYTYKQETFLRWMVLKQSE